MSDTALSVIQAAIVTLNADATVNGLLAGRIYTDVPQKATFPYLVLSIDSEPFAAASFSGSSHRLRLQAFSQASSVEEVLNVRAAAANALDRKETAITLTGLIKCEYAGAGTFFQEDDGKTWQAIAELEVIVV